MPDIPYVRLAVDGVTVNSATPAIAGSPSASLTQDAPTLVLGIGNCRNNGSGSASLLQLRVGGTVYAQMNSAAPFGSPAYGALGSPQLAAFFTVTPGASDELEFYASDISAAAMVDSARAIALDLTEIPANDGRWHQESANNDTIVTTPTSGATTVGSTLVVTAPRTGDCALLVSAQYVGDGTEADTDREHAWVEVDIDGGGFTTLSGSIENNGLGAAGTVYQTIGAYAWGARVTLSAGSTYTFRLRANGTDSNGNLGWRRIRLHLLEASRFEDSDLQSDSDTAGLTVSAGTGPQTVSGLSCTLNPPAARDYLVLGFAQGQFAAWPRLDLRVGSTSYPANGVADAAVDTGVTAADDMTMTVALDVVTGVSSSSTLSMRVETAAGGGDSMLGTDCARTDDGTGGGTPEGGAIWLLAIRLATPSGSTFDGGCLDESPADDSATGQRVRHGAGTDASAGDDSATGQRLRGAAGGDTSPADDTATGQRVHNVHAVREFSPSLSGGRPDPDA